MMPAETPPVAQRSDALLSRIRRIHGFGFRSWLHDDAHLHLLGKNWSVPVFVLMFAGISLLAIDFLFLDKLTTGPETDVLMVLVLLTGAGGTVYFTLTVAMRREIIFTTTQVRCADRFLIGRKEKRFDYAQLKSIRFETIWRSGAYFKSALLFLEDTEGNTVPLVQDASPMYSWQGEAAYTQLEHFLDRHEQGHLLAAAPDFTWPEKPPDPTDALPPAG